jgi:hypothetical protein
MIKVTLKQFFGGCNECGQTMVSRPTIGRIIKKLGLSFSGIELFRSSQGWIAAGENPKRFLLPKELPELRLKPEV